MENIRLVWLEPGKDDETTSLTWFESLFRTTEVEAEPCEDETSSIGIAHASVNGSAKEVDGSTLEYTEVEAASYAWGYLNDATTVVVREGVSDDDQLASILPAYS